MQKNNKKKPKIYKLKLLFLIIVFVLIIEYVLKIIIKKNKKIRWLITDTDEIKKNLIKKILSV